MGKEAAYIGSGYLATFFSLGGVRNETDGGWRAHSLSSFSEKRGGGALCRRSVPLYARGYLRAF